MTTCSHCRRVTGSPTTVDLCVCVSSGPARAAWGPCSSLCRSSAQVAPARFLAAGGFDAPCRLLPCAPNLAQDRVCGVHLLVTAGAVKCARIIGRRLVCPIVVGCGFALVRVRSSMCLSPTCSSAHILSRRHPQPGSNRGSLGCELYTQPGSNWRPSAC